MLECAGAAELWLVEAVAADAAVGTAVIRARRKGAVHRVGVVDAKPLMVGAGAGVPEPLATELAQLGRLLVGVGRLGRGGGGVLECFRLVGALAVARPALRLVCESP